MTTLTCDACQNDLVGASASYLCVDISTAAPAGKMVAYPTSTYCMSPPPSMCVKARCTQNTQLLVITYVIKVIALHNADGLNHMTHVLLRHRPRFTELL